MIVFVVVVGVCHVTLCASYAIYHLLLDVSS